MEVFSTIFQSKGPEILRDLPDYAFRNFINEGSFGAVYKFKKRSTGKYVAVKVNKNERLSHESKSEFKARLKEDTADFKREARTLNTIVKGLPNCLQIQQFVEFRNDDRLCIITDLHEGTLHDLVCSDRAPQPTLFTAWRHILRAIIHLVSAGYSHRDIHPGNIFFSYKTSSDPSKKIVFVLGDFGLATHIGTADGKAGNLAFRPMEMLTEGPSTATSDVYSLWTSICYSAKLVTLRNDDRHGENFVNMKRMTSSMTRGWRSIVTDDPYQRPSAAACLETAEVWGSFCQPEACTIPSSTISSQHTRRSSRAPAGAREFGHESVMPAGPTRYEDDSTRTMRASTARDSRRMSQSQAGAREFDHRTIAPTGPSFSTFGDNSFLTARQTATRDFSHLTIAPDSAVSEQPPTCGAHRTSVNFDSRAGAGMAWTLESNAVPTIPLSRPTAHPGAARRIPRMDYNDEEALESDMRRLCFAEPSCEPSRRTQYGAQQYDPQQYDDQQYSSQQYEVQRTPMPSRRMSTASGATPRASWTGTESYAGFIEPMRPAMRHRSSHVTVESQPSANTNARRSSVAAVSRPSARRSSAVGESGVSRGKRVENGTKVIKDVPKHLGFWAF